MADIGSDILEIHVHGTQAVCIKQEKYFITNENVSPSNIKVSDVERNGDTFHLKLQSIPLVYTTRLDQMNTFKKIGKLTSDEVAEKILVESKPQYKQITKEIKQENDFNSYVTSFIELCSHVQQLNTKVKTETHLRNAKLMKMCKPLKIVLEDIKANKRLLSSKTLAFKDYSTDEDASILDSSEDDVPLSKSTQRRSGSSKYYITTVALKYKRSQEADIYVLELAKGLISYYRTTIDELETIQELHNSNRTMALEYCCWGNREKKINKLSGWGGIIRPSHTLFLRKPHNCLPRPCTCCCVYATVMPKKPSNIEFVTYSNKSVTEVSAPVKNLIHKAYKYNPRIPSITPDINHKTDHLKCAVIIIKYHLVIFAQTELLGENYEIGSTGEINSYTKPTVNRSIAEERELYRKNDDFIENFRIYFSFLICCWNKRQETIAQLRDSSKLSLSASRFMRTPHLCRSDKCECCCKPAPLNKLPLENIITKKNISYASYKKQILVKVPVNQNIHEENMYFLCQDTRTNTKSFNKILHAQKSYKSTNNPRATQNNIKSTTKKLSKPTVEYESIDLTTESNHKTSPGLTKQKTSLKQRKQIVKVPSKTNGEYIDSKTTLALINHTFDQFKDIKLAVNQNGKLTAKINTPPGQLMPAAIKCLSDVLLLASKHVTQLGITPQDFCNQVNFSRALNGHCTTSIPELVPTIDSSTSDEATTNNDRQTPGDATCKATQCSSMLPKTQNKNVICSTFRMMSSLGGVKNHHLVRAYKLHFKEITEEVRVPLPVGQSSNIDQNKQSSAIPNNAKVNAVQMDEPKIKKARARPPVAKRKKLVEDNPGRKKLRVKPPEDLTLANPLPDKSPSALAELKEGPVHEPTQFYVSNTNLIPIQNTSNTVADQNNVTAKMPAPTHNGYPLLYKMLAKDSPLHPPGLVPINSRPRGQARARTQMSVRSLIDAHKNQPKKRKPRNNNNEAPATSQETQVNIIKPKENEMDCDIESSLKTTVIQMVKRGEDPIKNAVNTVLSTNAVNMEPIVIVDDDEEEGIFGV